MKNSAGTKTVWITIPWFYPAWRAGGPVQSVQNLVAEFTEGIEYRIYCGHAEWDGSPLPGIETNKWVPYNPWTQVWYATAEKRGQTFVREIESVAPDVIFVNGIYDWHFNILPLLAGRKIRRIVSVRGMLHPGALAQKSLKKKLYLGVWKMLGLHRSLEFHAATGEEKHHIETVFGKGARVHIAANLPRTLERQEVRKKERGSLSLVTVALVSPMKNILLILEALQTISEKVDYHLYGPVMDKAYWQQCTAVIRGLPPNIKVHSHGGLHPAELPQALEKGHIFILPSRSENFCHAIYEALSAGKPVITSHQTPWNSLLEAGAGRNVAVKNSGELAETIRYFAAMTAPELEQWSRGAKKYAEERIDLGRIRRQYRLMFLPGYSRPEKDNKDNTKESTKPWESTGKSN